MMASMREWEGRRRHTWAAAFAVALGAFIASLAVLAAVLLSVSGDEGGLGPVGSGPDEASAASSLLLYTGALAPGLGAEEFREAPPGSEPDLSFEPGAPGGFAVRYFVPVAAVGAGVDAVDRATLDGLLAGAISDWGQVGGVPGKVAFVVAGGDEDRALVARFTGGAVPASVFATYAELRAAMTPASGFLAFVPLEETWPGAVALAVDGVDLVRGRGDPGAWPFVQRLAVAAHSERGQAAVPGIRARLEQFPPAPITVVATGDIIQARCTLAKLQALGDWGAPLRGPVGEYLASADLALASLDQALQDINPPYGCVAVTNLSSPPQAIEALQVAGIDEVTVATNHAFDCGRDYCGSRAFLRTLELLGQAAIRHAGGGRNLEEALAPVVFEVRGVRFGILAFDDIAAMELEATADAPGTAPLDDDYSQERAAGEPAFYRPAEDLGLIRFTERIRQLKAQVDVVVVQVHTGVEDTHDPSPRSLKALRAAADAGADLVVGNHPHWAGATEVRGEAFITYALGNFIFDQRHTPEHEQGYLLEATFLGPKLATVKLRPYRIQEQHRPVFVEGAERAKILGDVSRAAAKLPPER
jgi:poly-gamma-glutamate synthesis protein (capsule biosynthesis protein)